MHDLLGPTTCRATVPPKSLLESLMTLMAELHQLRGQVEMRQNERLRGWYDESMLGLQRAICEEDRIRSHE